MTYAYEFKISPDDDLLTVHTIETLSIVQMPADAIELRTDVIHDFTTDYVFENYLIYINADVADETLYFIPRKSSLRTTIHARYENDIVKFHDVKHVYEMNIEIIDDTVVTLYVVAALPRVNLPADVIPYDAPDCTDETLMKMLSPAVTENFETCIPADLSDKRLFFVQR